MKDSITSLFKPFDFGTLKLRNRLVMASIEQERSSGEVSANEGAGLVIAEASYINHPSAGEIMDLPRLESGSEAYFSEMVKAIHATGGVIFAQLFHQGADDSERFDPSLAWSPSGFSATRGSYGKVMTLDDIDEIIAAFAEAAGFAQSVGFDGVEIHGAHGYLIDQFLWANTNRREDVWGGTIRNRAQFAAQIIAAVRRATGRLFPISFLFSQWKVGANNAAIATSPQDLEILLDPIVQAGVTILHASDGHFDQPAFRNSDRSLAVWAKELTELPTIAGGSIDLSLSGRPAYSSDLEILIWQLDNQQIDLVAVGRKLFSEPTWVSELQRLSQ
ncbi:12-oxophytodienoate reductase [Xenorhabdus sp. KJ12.1]|uniref:oxidoreductase n=1 Tax=Xenorhabdus sp. KJ12.1 TaxID=1851571 RepID=UPI000C03AC5B|nr:12-oxophytodienoate reductase [Xenorhabdus sp. KJ12.1]PHM69780.1 alkene reductase [Xenorhabdus sp. KJ12.1]